MPRKDEKTMRDPRTRLSKWLAKIAGVYEEDMEPKTETEYFLSQIAENGGGSVGGVKIPRVVPRSMPAYGDVDGDDLPTTYYWVPFAYTEVAGLLGRMKRIPRRGFAAFISDEDYAWLRYTCVAYDEERGVNYLQKAPMIAAKNWRICGLEDTYDSPETAYTLSIDMKKGLNPDISIVPCTSDDYAGMTQRTNYTGPFMTFQGNLPPLTLPPIHIETLELPTSIDGADRGDFFIVLPESIELQWIGNSSGDDSPVEPGLL